MTAYTLPSITNTAVGTFVVKLYSDFAGLTVPTANTILEVGEREESADAEIGIMQLGTLKLRIKDDYTVYTEGFWYKVLGSGCQIRLYLTEDGVDLFYFYGVPQEETIEWNEFFLGATYSREVTLSLLSVASSMLDTATTTWVDDVVTNAVDTGDAGTGTPTWVIRPTGLFAAMLKTAGLNSTYDLTDATFVYNTVDFKYTEGASEYRLDEVYCPVKYNSGLQIDLAVNYFDHATPNKLEGHYATLRGLLADLLTNLGVIMVMDYDTATERHLIKLVQRGRAYSTALTFASKEKTSTISKSFDLLGDATRSISLIDSTKFCWFSFRYSASPTTSAVPSHVDFDRDTKCIWAADSATPHTSFVVWAGGAGGTKTTITGITYFNYTTGLDVIATATSSKMQEAIAGYIYYRFTNKFALIRRTYGRFRGNNGATDSFANIGILRRTSINDGNGAVNYYANRVVRRPMNDEVEIEWIRETV